MNRVPLANFTLDETRERQLFHLPPLQHDAKSDTARFFKFIKVCSYYSLCFNNIKLFLGSNQLVFCQIICWFRILLSFDIIYCSW